MRPATMTRRKKTTGTKTEIIKDNMYIVISATGPDMEINETFHKTEKEAKDAMLKDILRSTHYKNLDEIIADANAGLCGFSDDGAWAETKRYQPIQWKIVKIPNT